METKLGLADGKKLVLFWMLLLGFILIPSIFNPSLLAADDDIPIINNISVNNIQTARANLGSITYDQPENMSYCFAAELSGLTGDTAYTAVLSLAGGSSTPGGPISVSLNGNNASFGTLVLQASTNYAFTCTLFKSDTQKQVDQVSFNITTAVLDTTPPQVESATKPSDINGNILLYFSEEIDPSTITNSNVVLRDADNSSIACENFSPQTSGGKTSLIINPVDSLKYSTTYTLNINGLKDLAGNSITEYHLSFQTPADPTPVVPLAIVSSTPSNNAQNVSVKGPFTITFNRKLKVDTVNAQTVYLTNSNGALTDANLSVTNATGAGVITLTPRVDLLNSATYSFCLVKSGTLGVTDENGLVMDTTVITFTTVSGATPAIIFKSPVASASSISVNTVISFQFNQDMNANTIYAGSVYLQREGGGAVFSTVSYNASSRMVSITPLDRLESGIRYYVYVTPTVKGTNGVSTNAVNWWFITTPASTSTIIERDPAANATGVSIDKSIKFRFNTYMNAASINNSTVYLTRSGGVVSASVSYDTYYDYVTIIPSSNLNSYTEYQVNVTSGVKDSNLNSTTTSSWKFTTGYENSGGISSRDPYANETGVSVSKTITFYFDKAMRSSTITSSNIYLTRGNYSVDANVSYSTSTRKVTISPDSNLLTGTEYTMHITDNVRDENGNYISETSWKFKTTGSSYTTGGVSNRDPNSNETGVALNKVIKFRFDTGMKSTTITESNIYLTKGGATVSAKVSYDSSTRWVTITPNSNLLAGTEYKVNLSSNLRDDNGDYLNATSWKFTTTSGVKNSLKIVSQEPYPLSTGIPVNSVIKIGFNAPLDASSVNNSNISLIAKNGNIVIPCSLNYDSSVYRVSLSPSRALSAGTEYTVFVGNGVKDINGNTGTTLSWSFTTTGAAAVRKPGQPSKPAVILDGKQVVFTDATPYIKNARTLVPYRQLLELMGATVSWDEKSKKVSAVLKGQSTELVIGSKKAYRNSQVVMLDVAPEIKNGRTMIPIRFVAESLGVKTDWDPATYTVIFSR